MEPIKKLSYCCQKDVKFKKTLLGGNNNNYWYGTHHCKKKTMQIKA